jgi:hypothetical protein
MVVRAMSDERTDARAASRALNQQTVAAALEDDSLDAARGLLEAVDHHVAVLLGHGVPPVTVVGMVASAAASRAAKRACGL